MYRQRYWWLSAVVFAAMLAQNLNQYWAGDFWEHAAVVRELVRHPWAPGHPLFGIGAPHPYFSPYALGVALIARLTRLPAVTALAVLGMANLIGLLVAFYLFVSALLSSRAAFFGLLFTLLLWGFSPWRYSGFLHLSALGFVLPYPSIFAMWLMLFTLYALLRYREHGSVGWAAVIVVGAPIVLLTHPITGIMLAAGLIAFSARLAVRQPRRFVGLGAAVLLASAAGVSLWPYYPFFRLIATGSETYAVPNLAMYDGAFQRAWPALIGAPFVVRRLAADKLDGLGLFVLTLSILYALGGLISNGPLGRVLPALVLGLHLALADAVANFEDRLRAIPARAQLRYLYGAIALVAAIGLANAAPALLRVVPRPLLPGRLRADPRLERELDTYTLLASQVGGDDVVMADLNVGRHVPAFAGKVVAFIDPEAFVPDQESRRQAVFRFFDEASADEREAIITRYGVKFVAVDARSPLPASTDRWLASHAAAIPGDGRLRLFRMSP